MLQNLELNVHVIVFLQKLFRFQTHNDVTCFSGSAGISVW